MPGPCCGEKRGETLIFTCAGAAHCGQVANRAGIQLMQDGAGSLFCAAAVAAQVPDKLERARNAGRRVVIDGCADHCARKILEKAGLLIELHLDVATIGILKKPDPPELIRDAKRVAAEVRARSGSGA